MSKVKAKQKWVKIADKDIRSIWTCPFCKSKGDNALISPDWYESNGTPQCLECDTDMIYSHTEIQKQ